MNDEYWRLRDKLHAHWEKNHLMSDKGYTGLSHNNEYYFFCDQKTKTIKEMFPILIPYLRKLVNE